MNTGSSSDSMDMTGRGRGGAKLSSVMGTIDPFVPRTDHNPRELRSWAKRTGFVSNTFSGDTGTSASEKNDSAGYDLERGLEQRGGGSSPKIEIDPILGRTRPNRRAEIEPATGYGNGNGNGNVRMRNENNGVLGSRDGTVGSINQGRRVGGEHVLDGGIGHGGRKVDLNGNGKGNERVNEAANRIGNANGNVVGVAAVTSVTEPKKDADLAERDMEMNFQPDGEELAYGEWRRPSGMKCGLRENPGFAPLIYYGLQHYLSLAGSLIFIPLIIVPAMGGTDKDTATVISTMLLISGVTTILHSYFGTRLPLVQGSSFVYLAPALVIINAQEYRNLTEHKFRHIMRELQGAIIVGSIFQSLLGFSGLMTLFLRLINPVVVAPTVAAVGLAFFSYGFPQAGSCVEISIPLILLVLIFTLVPLSIMIIWIYAFFLTAGGAYNYKGCSPDVPSSNILIDACRKHAYTMKHCRTDVSSAWRTAAWVRVPYPLQWGTPIFHLRTSLIMIIVSFVASVDSVGTYHTTSVIINLKPPTSGIVSRGIALEGFCSMLAGFWGSGTGSTTLTENVHTIEITKVASRRAMEIGALFLIFFSFIGIIP